MTFLAAKIKLRQFGKTEMDKEKNQGGLMTQRARKVKKVQTKKLMKSNSRIIFLTKFHFCYFKNGQKSIFELGKTTKNVISRKNFFDLFGFTSFFL